MPEHPTDFDAEEALDLGIVMEIVPPDRLLDRALEIAQQVAAGPPLGLAAAKRLVYAPDHDDFLRTQDLTSMYANTLLHTEDGAEGVRSFMERREPVFRGR